MRLSLSFHSLLSFMTELTPKLFKELFEDREVFDARRKDASQANKGLQTIADIYQAQCSDRGNSFGGSYCDAVLPQGATK